MSSLELVRWTLVAIVIVGVLTWVARTRSTARLDDGELRYPIGVFAVGFVTALLFTLFAVLSYSAATGGPRVAAVFGGLALLGTYLLIEYFVVRFRVTEGGLEYRTVWGGQGNAAWADVAAIRWSPNLKWFVVSLHSRKVVRLSAMLAGLPFFAKEFLAHGPRDRASCSTLTILMETASGRPPALW